MKNKIRKKRDDSAKQCARTFFITDKECIVCNGRNQRCTRYTPNMACASAEELDSLRPEQHRAAPNDCGFGMIDAAGAQGKGGSIA